MPGTTAWTTRDDERLKNQLKTYRNILVKRKERLQAKIDCTEQLIAGLDQPLPDPDLQRLLDEEEEIERRNRERGGNVGVIASGFIGFPR